MKKLVLVFGVVLALCTTAMASDIAFYVGGWNPGWYDATQFDDVTIIIDEAGHNFKDIQQFDDSAAGFDAFTAWIDENTDDGELDIIWLNGTMPSVLYQFPNVDPDGSPAETWLDNGNMFINVGDWFAYMSYEGGSRSADNGPSGAANILDLAGGIFVGGPQGTMEITAAGTEYLPSLTAVASDRPLVLSELAAPWEVAEIFAQNSGGTHADPIVIRNTETDGYLAVVNQNAGGGWLDSRGLTCAELINNWIGPIVGLSDPALAAPLNPDDGVIDVPRDVDLTWLAGEFAVTHDVYFGTNSDDVNDATTPDSAGQTGTSYDPGILTFGQTYFWRIDEVNGAPDRTVFKGQVWSFEVEPAGYPITNVTATASSSNADTMGPENTVNGSGLNELDQHSSVATDMWLSAPGDANPWIQYEFDKAQKLHQLMVWNQNQLIEAFVGLGAKDVVIETSLDGAEWVVLEGATQFNQATGAETYTANTTIDLGGVMAKFVRITVNASWGGVMPNSGLSEVRFFFIPTFAREPQPVDGSTTDDIAVALGWRAGREAVSHEVSLGTDPAGLALVATVTDNSLDLADQDLQFNTTYYWMVNEVNAAGTPTAYEGPVWSFTTPPYGIVDDFEQYNDKCERIFFAWEDGIGHNGGEEVEDCDEPASNGNGGGSMVGNNQAPFAEKTIVYLGSSQSLPFDYDNAFGDSYATLAIPGENWGGHGTKTLSLAFRGETGNTGTLYIKINNTKISYDGPASDIAGGWQTWNIVLADTGANLGNVTSFVIGVDGANAAGKLYIDDIRLLPDVIEEGEAIVDIAISSQAGWFGQGAANREMLEIINNVPQASIEVFTAGDHDVLADWVSAHTNNGVANLLILCGQFPDTIYGGGNAEPDGSLAELFLDAGNTIVNTGDYMFYVNSAGTNSAAGGLENMMDIPGITMWDDNTDVVVTAEAQDITPTLLDFATDRPFHLDELEGDWFAELILAQNADGTRADPVIVKNSVTSGRLGIFYQTNGQDNDPRGEVISEWINNWYLGIVSGGGN